MQSRYERVPYDHAVFTCTACTHGMRCSYGNVSSLLKGGTLTCSACGTVTVLSEDDRNRLNERLKNPPRSSPSVEIADGVYLLLVISLLLIFKAYGVVLLLIALFVLMRLINFILFSRKELNLELLPLNESGRQTDAAQ